MKETHPLTNNLSRGDGEVLRVIELEVVCCVVAAEKLARSFYICCCFNFSEESWRYSFNFGDIKRQSSPPHHHLCSAMHAKADRQLLSH